MRAKPKAAEVKPRRFGPPVPGVIVPDSGLDGIEWGLKRRISPYDLLLQQLQSAADGHVIRFENPRCRTSILVRARKLGIRILLGERDGALYVKLDPTARASNRDRVLAALRDGPKTVYEIAAYVREHGAEVGAPMAENIVRMALKAGEVMVPGVDGKWRLAKK